MIVVVNFPTQQIKKHKGKRPSYEKKRLLGPLYETCKGTTRA
jgi:hypothetical protein